MINRLTRLFNIMNVMLFSLLIISCSGNPGAMDSPVTSVQSIQSIQSMSSIPSEGSRILLVNTNHSIERYRLSQAAFIETLPEKNVHIVDLNGIKHPIESLQDLLNDHHFDAVYCIGAKALASIDYIDPDVPVIFSSVLSWQRFSTQPNYYGVASEVASEAQLTWFKYFFPETKKIGVLYSAENKKLVRDAIISANNLSIKVIAEEVSSQSSVLEKTEELLPLVDALWLISDSTVLTSIHNTKQLFESTEKYRIPVFSYDSIFIAMGATLSISADKPTTGRQAALMMRNVLGNDDVQQAPVQFPAGSNITLNLGKVRSYSMRLNESALDSVNNIVGE